MELTAGYADDDLIAELMSPPVEYCPPDACHFCAGTVMGRYTAEWKGRTYAACDEHYELFRQMLDGEAWSTGYEFAHADLLVEERPIIKPIGRARPIVDPERTGIPAALLIH